LTGVQRVLLVQPIEGARWRSITAYADSLANMLREAGAEVDVAEAPWFNPPSLVRGLRRRWWLAPPVQAALRGEYDLVHLTDHALAHHIGRFTRRLPVVVTCHDLMQLRLSGYYTTRRERWLKQAFLRRSIAALPRADAVIAVSEFTRAQLKEHFGSAFESTVVPNVVRPAFRPVPRAEAEARLRATGIELPPAPRVMSVGNDRAYKNLDALIEAMALPALAHVSLVRVGPFTKRHRALAEALGVLRRTALVRPIDDAALADVYAACDVLAQPSLGEGFGIPVIEAMACGIPVVVSDGGALPEVAGGAGFVVPLGASGFPARFGQALLRAIGHPGEFARDAAPRADLFRPAAVTPELLHAYARALDEHARRA
jgi:glycosyltransferase involved in cell wall biosynthesis